MDKKFENFKTTVNIVVNKRSKNRKYNLEAVSKMLGIDTGGSYSQQCDKIISFLESKRSTNEIIDEILKQTRENKEDLCDVLVSSLYELFSPSSLPEKSPITITKEEYIDLLEKKKENDITFEENEILDEALNVKYCHCVKKLYLKNLFKKYILDEEIKYSPYAICMSSIYKNRDITPPFKVSHSCREKYQWYK
jgi:hypothetical protein